MIYIYLKSPDPNLSLVWNGLCIYHCKVRLLMQNFWTLACALLPSLRGRSCIGNVSNKPEDLLNSRWIAAGTQLRGSIE